MPAHGFSKALLLLFVAVGSGSDVSSPSLGLAATEVNTCGQSYNGSGFLTADLDCTGFPSPAVVIDGGSLDLRGFTLTGGTSDAIQCTASCTVTSDPAGGQIVGAGGYAISTAGVPTMRISNVVIDSCADGIDGGGRVIIEDSTITNGGPSSNVASATQLKLLRTTVDGVGEFATGGNLKVVDSMISNCITRCLNGGNVRVRNSTIAGSTGDGVAGGSDELTVIVDSAVTGHAAHGISQVRNAKIIRSTVTGNGGRGVYGSIAGPPGTILVRDSDISGNDLDGVRNDSAIRIVRSTITANGRSGISTGTMFESDCTPVRLTDSTVTGNGTDGAVCGVADTCADLATCQNPPVLNSTTCDTSYDTDSGFPGTSWGVCSLD